MFSDFHLHSDFSGDCTTPMELMIEQAIKLKLSSICFTDHYDLDYPGEPNLFLFDVKKYYEKIIQLQDKYRAKIHILVGIELGLQPHLQHKLTQLLSQYAFDFVIGSSHVVNGIDPYYPAYYENRTEEECYYAYFESILQNIQAFSDFDVYGHLDYVVRYGPNKATDYSYTKYQDVFDQILRLCIEKGIGIELNTGGLAYGLDFAHPHPDILKRYKQLGGEIITIGSDGHVPERLAHKFSTAIDLLKACGFSYYSVFQNRKAEFIKL